MNFMFRQSGSYPVPSQSVSHNHDNHRLQQQKSVLRDHVAQAVRRYLRDLNGCDANDIYDIVLQEMEIPLFTEILKHCDGNQSRAAAMLGIHRATLRKKLQYYGLTNDRSMS